MTSICVYASASNDLSEKYIKLASELGYYIAKEGYDVVYGGSKRGLMYSCAASAKQNGSKVYGVMPRIFSELGLANPEDCDDFFLTEGMRERKAKLDELSDAIIALPGGFGTLEELAEMIVQKQLCYNNKPIVILNYEGFYSKLIDFFEHTIKENFAKPDNRKLYHVATTAKDAVSYIKNYIPENISAKYVIK